MDRLLSLDWRYLEAIPTGISSDGQIDEKPEQIASGTGKLGCGGSASEDGKLAYCTVRFQRDQSTKFRSMTAAEASPTQQYPLRGGICNHNLSRGRAFGGIRHDAPDKPNSILVRISETPAIDSWMTRAESLIMAERSLYRRMDRKSSLNAIAKAAYSRGTQPLLAASEFQPLVGRQIRSASFVPRVGSHLTGRSFSSRNTTQAAPGFTTALSPSI
jgi:hypothetical protein